MTRQSRNITVLPRYQNQLAAHIIIMSVGVIVLSTLNDTFDNCICQFFGLVGSVLLVNLHFGIQGDESNCFNFPKILMMVSFRFQRIYFGRIWPTISKQGGKVRRPFESNVIAMGFQISLFAMTNQHDRCFAAGVVAVVVATDTCQHGGSIVSSVRTSQDWNIVSSNSRGNGMNRGPIGNPLGVYTLDSQFPSVLDPIRRGFGISSNPKNQAG
mmetsp:Transcript_21971/g.33563  ORF Transcript_21971/g.33563 Transcript_21971/m.33563 type:complete len:213 (+) Transcript_21971:440-1078(+)